VNKQNLPPNSEEENENEDEDEVLVEVHELKTTDSQGSKTAVTLTAPEGEQRCEETAPQHPDDGSGISVGAWDTSLGGHDHSPTDDGGAKLSRPEVDSDRESAADDVENGEDSLSDATLGEGDPATVPEWLRSREFVLTHQVDKRPEWQRKKDFLADLIKSGDIQMKSDNVVKLVCSIITK